LMSVFSFAQIKEQEAIKKICIAETEAYVNMDYNTWASCHVQSPEEQLAWNNPDGSFGVESGWEKISNGMKDWFKTATKEILKLSSDNYVFVIRGDMAFVSFDRSSQNAEGKTTLIHEYRTLLKKAGEWKILAVQAFVNHPSAK
jgi:hypothetical protein